MIQYQDKNLTVFQSALYKTTTVVIHTEEAIIMTDPNWLPEEVQEIRNYISQHIGNKKLYIIYTHSDFDHIIGASAFPEAYVIASVEFSINEHKKEIMKQIEEFDQKYYLYRNYTPSYPIVDYQVVNDGETLQIGEVTLHFYKSPGHTADGIFTVVEPYGIFLSGDYLSDVEFPFIFSGYRDYVHTINKAYEIYQTYNINYHVPGHGTTTGDKEEMARRVEVSRCYLEQLSRGNEQLEEFCKKEYDFFEGMKDIHESNKEKVD
ncbi:MBL fold metallo-hydrolase [Oceanobacillus sp. 1P07AA]|uniref:MBL fold metallo-hydrolase n=1 Tax=Oceanobacillus sp. 1P07AA TaxID=3132293 RepID=UPI0039A552C6